MNIYTLEQHITIDIQPWFVQKSNGFSTKPMFHKQVKSIKYCARYKWGCELKILWELCSDLAN